MTAYNNSYDSNGLYGDHEGDEQEAYELTERQRRRMRLRTQQYLESPFCSVEHCQNHTRWADDGLCTHHHIQTLTFELPDMWRRK